MNIQRTRTNPHDHSPNALSNFGVVRLPNNEDGNPRFMCLACHEVWTVPAAKRLKHGFWVCPYSCNEDFTSDDPDPQNVLWAMFAIVRQFHNEADFNEALWYVMDNIYNTDPLCFNWRDALQTILDLANDASIKPGVFGSELALNALRHYVAHLAKHFKELVPDGADSRQRGKCSAAESMVNLTSLWEKAGADPTRTPSLWLDHEDNVEFIKVFMKKYETDVCVWRKGASQFAHPVIGIAYAEYLNPEFHAWCLCKTAENFTASTETNH